MLNQDQDFIIDRLNCEDWQTVVDEFYSLSLEEIKSALDYMWPEDDNGELAEKIDTEVNNNA